MKLDVPEEEFEAEKKLWEKIFLKNNSNGEKNGD
jgi:hypothetical protein